MRLPRISRDTVASVGTAVAQATISALVAKHIISPEQGLNYTAIVVAAFTGYRTKNGAQVAVAASSAVQDVAPVAEKAVPASVEPVVAAVASTVETDLGAPAVP